MEEYVKITRESYDRLTQDSEVLVCLLNDDNVLIMHEKTFGYRKTFYTVADESDFRTAIKSKDEDIQMLKDKIKNLLKFNKSNNSKKEGFWRSFATAIYRTP